MKKLEFDTYTQMKEYINNHLKDYEINDEIFIRKGIKNVATNEWYGTHIKIMGLPLNQK